MYKNQMSKSADQATSLLKALSGRSRLMILCQLVDGEQTVGELADALEMRQAAVSQQLALLRKDGLVSARREARTMHYSLAGEEARRIIEVLYELFCDTDEL
ncbi:helix-turn-helix transcriptional regulator [Marinobacter sp. SS8-8]|uniref:ArsR/SmtB family transcription factor n=1 Tax=Marinobacter sp. SS8-8 TaxID=3050452 RepID=UPI0026DFF997|nr:metalloregulator ArsR/SmtB family transcription factor [Marinobacter sp. SS8-8]